MPRPSLPVLAFCLASLAAPALAQEVGPPLSAEEFDALTRGKTITYAEAGRIYGIEEYRPGRKVVWAFAEGDCREGDWFAQGAQICFDYHDPETGLQCWTFHRRGKDIVAWFEGERSGEPLVSLQESPEPLNCPGPEIGV